MSLPAAAPVGRLLLVYLHLRPGTPEATTHLLRDYVTAYADEAGYALGEVFVGREDGGELRTVRELLAAIERRGADTVVVCGPGNAAVAALRHLTQVQVLTLAEVSIKRRRAR